MAAGGDPSRIFVVTSDFRLPRDIPALKRLALEFSDVGLIGIDPLGNHLLSTDTDGEGTVRNAIAGLNVLADELDCIVKGVRHLSKDVSKGALASVLGSTAWVDVPRVVIVMAADDEDDYVFHAQVVAGNRGPRGAAGRQFRLDLVDVGLLEPVTRLLAEGESTKDVEVLLNGNGHASTSRSAQARKLILDILDDAREIESDTLDARVAAETGLASGTVRNIRSKLKDDAGKVVRWCVSRTSAPRDDVTWESPDNASKDLDDATPLDKQTRPRYPWRESRYLVYVIRTHITTPRPRVSGCPKNASTTTNSNASHPSIRTRRSGRRAAAVTRRRVIGTHSPRHRIEVETGADPVRALVAALTDLTASTRVGVCHVHHDDDCPCLAMRPMSDCTCEIVALVVDRWAA